MSILPQSNEASAGKLSWLISRQEGDSLLVPPAGQARLRVPRAHHSLIIVAEVLVPWSNCEWRMIAMSKA
jgi:hypothetical protein